MTPWTELSKPVSPAHNTLIARAMSALTKDGRRPTFSEAEAYAREQMADHPSYFAGSYSELTHGY